jgi:hypothetical protein
LLVGLVLAPTERPAVTQEVETTGGQSAPELERLLMQRDEIIIQLLRRVDALERRLAAIESAAPPAPAAGPQPPESAERVADRGPLPAVPGVPAPKPPTPAAPLERTSPRQETSAETPTAPGRFEVDEAAAERALERTLVQGGALLLNAGEAEITPSFRFSRREDDAPIAFAADGETFVAEDDVRRNLFEWELGLRLGLPFDSQIEAGFPYRLVDQSEVTSVAFAAQQERSRSGSGLGDLSIGLAKTLLRERRWWPDLVGRVTWDTATGDTRDGGVLLGSGFHEITGSLTATKRQDPLVFVGEASYQKAFENDGIAPGDQLGFTVGTFLAASPEASLRLTFEQTFADEIEIDDREIEGSDRVLGSLNLGASVILGPRLLLDVVAGVGVTDDAPDYSIRASLPLRFDTPLR